MIEHEQPLISICIANYNGELLLADCIDSVLAQYGDFEVEVIVHDDASSDDSLAVLSGYPQVRLIASDRNVGFCVANNRMVEQACGRYVLLLNNDAELFPDAIATLLYEASLPGPSKILSLPQYDWESGKLVDRGCLLDPFHVPVPNLDPRRRHVAYVIGACLWVAREDWLRLGGFPEWMGSIGEDLFLCARARLFGMEVAVASGSGYRHRQGASFGGNRLGTTGLLTNYRRRRLSECNRSAVLAICTPGAGWLLWMTVHGIALLVEGGALVLLKRDLRLWRDVYGAALRWLWQQRTLLRTVRRDVQVNRRIGLMQYLRDAYTWRLRKLGMLFRYGLPELKQ